MDVPTLYVGESSRSLNERMGEHWSAWRRGKHDSHILKHQHLVHGGNQEPKFVARAVSFHRTALERQVGDAVRIRRRGGEGALLNSKSEYNRCRIPRLIVEEVDEEKSKLEQEKVNKELGEAATLSQKEWEKNKTEIRDRERKKNLVNQKPTSMSDNFDLKKFLELKKRERDRKLGHDIPGIPPSSSTTPTVVLMVPSQIECGEDDTARQNLKAMRYTAARNSTK